MFCSACLLRLKFYRDIRKFYLVDLVFSTFFVFVLLMFFYVCVVSQMMHLSLCLTSHVDLFICLSFATLLMFNKVNTLKFVVGRML